MWEVVLVLIINMVDICRMGWVNDWDDIILERIRYIAFRWTNNCWQHIRSTVHINYSFHHCFITLIAYDTGMNLVLIK